MKPDMPPTQPDDLLEADPRLGNDAAPAAGPAPEALPAPQDWRLTTAELLYRLPDAPSVLQSFVWQQLDLAPHYPALRRFLAFWAREIEGELHAVRVGRATIVPERAGPLH